MFLWYVQLSKLWIIVLLNMGSLMC